MRRLVLLFLFLGLVAPAHAGRPKRPSLRLTEAAITAGDGREPPPGHAPRQPTMGARLETRRLPRQVRLRYWKLPDRFVPLLAKGQAAHQVGNAALPLDLAEVPQAAGVILLSGVWPEAPREEDRLVVEAWVGERRVAWTASALEVHYLPVARPKGGEAER